ncbi:hypothetical protein pipiens_001550 [Culex pipiens pipiens]|uniref:Odorant receptor n=1 Tax=Culex pipiens pipiens TaxID=38569 RepID=A0ABD1CL69_CULPP
MQSLKAFSTQLREFDVNSDYFCLVDTIHTLFARIPLQLVAIQFMFETYLCCTMMDTLQTENKRIAEYVYVIDWLSVCRRTSDSQRKSAKCIRQNVLLLQLQIHEGLKIRAGNMFAVNRETFANLMRVVYSLLTFILRQTG